MSRVKDPTEKKQLSYRRDFLALSEYPHAHRRQWPKKEARAQRAHRHEVRQRLAADPPDEATASVADAHRKSVRQWGAMTLGDAVDRKLVRRDERVGWNLFKSPYTSARRERACRFFEAIVAERSRASSSLAARVHEALASDPLDLGGCRTFPMRPGVLRAWLEAFFRDEPSWGPRLRAWAASHA